MTHQQIADHWTPNAWAWGALLSPEAEAPKLKAIRLPLTPEQRKAKRREYCRNTRAYRKAQGRCTRCGSALCKNHMCSQVAKKRVANKNM